MKQVSVTKTTQEGLWASLLFLFLSFSFLCILLMPVPQFSLYSVSVCLHYTEWAFEASSSQLSQVTPKLCPGSFYDRLQRKRVTTENQMLRWLDVCKNKSQQGQEETPRERERERVKRKKKPWTIYNRSFPLYLATSTWIISSSPSHKACLCTEHTVDVTADAAAAAGLSSFHFSSSKSITRGEISLVKKSSRKWHSHSLTRSLIHRVCVFVVVSLILLLFLR